MKNKNKRVFCYNFDCRYNSGYKKRKMKNPKCKVITEIDLINKKFCEERVYEREKIDEQKNTNNVSNFFTNVKLNFLSFFSRQKLNFSDFLTNKKMAKQRSKNGYSDEDCFGLRYWFTSTLPKMVLNLRDNGFSIPNVSFSDIQNFPLSWINEECKNLLISKVAEKKEEDICLFEDWSEDVWYLILTRIAYCLKEADIDNCSYKNRFEKEFNKTFFNNSKSVYSKKIKETYFDEEYKILQYKNEMKNEALDLIKKYFSQLIG